MYVWGGGGGGWGVKGGEGGGGRCSFLFFFHPVKLCAKRLDLYWQRALLRRAFAKKPSFLIWGGYDEYAPNYRSLLQNIVCFLGLFCKKDLSF